MVETPAPTTIAPLTADAFYMDRMKVYGTFTRLSMVAAGAIVVLLILMAFFLL